jgi:serine/threonine protein kinase
MELVQGVTLERFVTVNPTPTLLLKWMQQLVLARVYMHGDCHIIHRDLKPAIVMVTQGTKNVKIIDFGLSRMMDLSAAATGRMTTGIGTPLYMSYEKLV